MKMITTETEALEAVQEDCLALEQVPEALRTRDVCFVAAYGNGQALQYVPENILEASPAIAVLAVGRNGMALQHVPERLKTPYLCFIAVHADGRALQYVPEELKTLASLPWEDPAVGEMRHAFEASCPGRGADVFNASKR